MVIRYYDILEIISLVSREADLQVTVKESLKGGLIAGTACTVGGILLGPAGLAVGGAVGGCAAAYLAQGKLKSVAEIVQNDLSDDDRERLVEAVRGVIGGAEVGDAVELLALVQGSQALKARVAQELITYFARNLNLQVFQGGSS